MDKELHYRKTIDLLQDKIAELAGEIANRDDKIPELASNLEGHRREIIQKEEKILELLDKFEEQERLYKQEIEVREKQIKGLLLENEEQVRLYKQEVETREKQERLYKKELAADEEKMEGLFSRFREQELLHCRELAAHKEKVERLLAERDERDRLYKQEISRRVEEVSSLEGQRSYWERMFNEILSTKTWRLRSFVRKWTGIDYIMRLRQTSAAFTGGQTIQDCSHSFSPDEGERQPEDTMVLSGGKGCFEPAGQCDVVCLPIIDWFFRYQRPQQIPAQFSENGSRVFYINPAFMEQGGELFRSTEIGKNIFDISINADPALNIYKDTIDDAALSAMFNSLEALRKESGIVEALCIVHLPFWHRLAIKVQEAFGWKVVYDCMDEHSGCSSNGAAMLSNEETLARNCDLLVTTATRLYERMAKFNQRCVLIQNAADFEHFSILPPNDLLKEMKRPIIGYYGAISEWFDNELVEHLAERRQDWSFVLIGHTCGSDISRLEKMSNVHLLGEQPYSELPEYLYWFDVCIIPFKLNDLIMATNPVKFYEYLCSGKKVVSVELPELLPYSQYLYLAKDKSDFLEKIAWALKENDPALVSARTAFAKDNTWKKRYEDLTLELRGIYPKVSVIIVTFNNLNYTKLCVESIFSKTQYPNYELIIVDNNSTDGTRDYLKARFSGEPHVKIILNSGNDGFARANNTGILASSGDYVILLNNDTIVTRGWITKLLYHLKDAGVGMVGPVTNSCGNEARITVPYADLDGLHEFSERFLRQNTEPNAFDIRMLAMYCVAMRKSLLDDVGLLDERFRVGMFEDDDYSHRVRQKGYRVVCAEDVFVHHFGEASFNNLKESGDYRKLFDENKRRFEEKWGTAWEPHKCREPQL